MLKQSKSLKKDEKLDRYLKGAESVLEYRSEGGDLTDRKFQDLLQRVQRQYRDFHADVTGLRIKSEMAKTGFTDETKWRLASYDDPEIYEKFKALGGDGYKGKRGYAGYGLLKKAERDSELKKILSGKDVFSDVSNWFKGFKEHDNMEKLHTGGVVGSTGPKFLEKGEVVLPKTYADGGLVAFRDGGQAKFSDAKFLDTATKADTSDLESAVNKFIGKLTSVIENSKVGVDVSGVSVPVVNEDDVTVAVSNKDNVTVAVVNEDDVTVSVDPTGAVVNVDATEAAARIATAIRTTTAGGTVGAERLDILAETVKAVDDRLINVKDSITTMVINATEQMQTVKSATEQKVKELKEEVRIQVSELRTKNADVVSSVSNVIHRYDVKINDLSYDVNKVTSLTMSNLHQGGI